MLNKYVLPIDFTGPMSTCFSADAGYESPDKRISAIEENTKGNIIRTLLELFYLWKDQVGSKINPKDIEDTFEKLEWNTQLHAFKKYLRYLLS